MAVCSFFNIKPTKNGNLKNYEAHLRRTSDTYRNENIDVNKINENVVLIDCKNSFSKEIEEIIQENNIEKLATKTNLLLQGLITLNFDYNDDLARWHRQDYLNYFKEHMDAFTAEYKGKIIYATVHFDETKPHLHFSWVPVVKLKDEKDLKKSDKKIESDRQKKALQYAKRHTIKEFNLTKSDKNLLNASDIKKLQLGKYSGDKMNGEYEKINTFLLNKYNSKMQEYQEKNLMQSKKMKSATISKTKLGLGNKDDFKRLQDFHFLKSCQILEKMGKTVDLVRKKNIDKKYIDDIEKFKALEKALAFSKQIEKNLFKEEKVQKLPKISKNILGQYKKENVEKVIETNNHLQKQLIVAKKVNVILKKQNAENNIKIASLINENIDLKDKLEKKFYFASQTEAKILVEKEKILIQKEEDLREKEQDIDKLVIVRAEDLIKNEKNLSEILEKMVEKRINQFKNKIKKVIDKITFSFFKNLKSPKIDGNLLKNDTKSIEKILDNFIGDCSIDDLTEELQDRTKKIKEIKVKVNSLETKIYS